jgi:hypothetical protein
MSSVSSKSEHFYKIANTAKFGGICNPFLHLRLSLGSLKKSGKITNGILRWCSICDGLKVGRDLSMLES